MNQPPEQRPYLERFYPSARDRVPEPGPEDAEWRKERAEVVRREDAILEARKAARVQTVSRYFRRRHRSTPEDNRVASLRQAYVRGQSTSQYPPRQDSGGIGGQKAGQKARRTQYRYRMKQT